MSDELAAPRLLVGLDLIEIERVERALERHPARFRERCFTAREIEELDRKPRPSESYAGRFAAKEAIGKALATPTKDLTLPVKKLVAEKKIVAKGERRATKYFGG